MRYAEFLLWGLLTATTVAGGPEGRGWRGLVPLHSTREDVELLLGPPASCSYIQCAYELEGERVAFTYSVGECEDGNYGWKVPRGAVVLITVTPRSRIPLAGLPLDLARYEKNGGCVRDSSQYENKDDGLFLAVYKGEVTDMVYFPSSADDHLACHRTAGAGR